ncbi:MAG TPA: hypothetical protein VGC06_22505 [Actinomycetes bacterium]
MTPFRVAAFVVALSTAGCTVSLNPPDTGRSAASSTTRRPVPTRVSVTRASANYQFEEGRGRQAAPRVLTANLPDDAPDAAASTFVLVLPVARTSTACLRRVELELRVLDGSGGENGTLAVYGVKRPALVSGRLDGTEAPSAYVAIRPRGIANVPPRPGWVRFDVTDLYELWADGRPFPNGETVAGGTPLVVQVRPPAYVPASSGRDSAFVRHFAAIAAGAGSAPRLRLTALRDC